MLLKSVDAWVWVEPGSACGFFKLLVYCSLGVNILTLLIFSLNTCVFVPLYTITETRWTHFSRQSNPLRHRHRRPTV